MLWCVDVQGVQKKLCHGFFTITPKRKGLGSKVRPFSENSGNSASDGHWNFEIWLFGSWENWVLSW